MQVSSGLKHTVILLASYVIFLQEDVRPRTLYQSLVLLLEEYWEQLTLVCTVNSLMMIISLLLLTGLNRLLKIDKIIYFNQFFLVMMMMAL